MFYQYEVVVSKKYGLDQHRITMNRSMIKRTFDEKGLDYTSELVMKNVGDLYKIIQWNEDNGIKFFRMSSETFPWALSIIKIGLSFQTLDLFTPMLSDCGQLATEYGHRLTATHPAFNVLVSPNENVVQNTITDLTIHTDIMDFMGLSRTPYNKLNIHCNGVYGDKQSVWIDFVKTLNDYLCQFNQDLPLRTTTKLSMYSVKDLYEGIHKRIGIPIVFDYHHYKFNTGGQTEQEKLEMKIIDKNR